LVIKFLLALAPAAKNGHGSGSRKSELVTVEKQVESNNGTKIKLIRKMRKSKGPFGIRPSLVSSV